MNSAGGPVPAWLAIAWAIAGCLVAAGGGCWLLFFFGPYVIWSKRFMIETRRESVELASKTVLHIENIHAEVQPILRDAKEVIGGVRELVDDLRAQNPKKLVEFVDKLSSDGTVDRLSRSVEKIADRIHEALEKVEKRKADDIVNNL